MLTFVGILAFVLALTVSVVLHEAGHFATARAFGMKATQFFAGFGPTLWSFRRGETEYGVKAIPAGGFVKIVGMTQLEELDPGDEDRAFFRYPARKRAVVLSAGSFMHFVIGFVLLFVVLSVVGQSTTTLTVGQVAPCVSTSASDAATTSCGPGSVASAAAAAGLRPGDRLVAIDGHQASSFETFSRMVRDHPGQQVAITFERDGRRITRTVTLPTVQRDALDGSGRTVAVGVLGVTSRLATDRLNPISGIARAGRGFGDYVVATFTALGGIPSGVHQLFDTSVHGGARNPDGLVGVAGIGRVSGQLASSDQPVVDRVGDFLLLIAGLNIFIGIFNLLPLLPLDGGHLAVLGFEEGRSRLYRLFGRRDPGRVDLTRLLPAAYLVIALFIGLSLLLLYSDIVNPIKNPFTG